MIGRKICLAYNNYIFQLYCVAKNQSLKFKAIVSVRHRCFDSRQFLLFQHYPTRFSLLALVAIDAHLLSVTWPVSVVACGCEPCFFGVATVDTATTGTLVFVCWCFLTHGSVNILDSLGFVAHLHQNVLEF